MSRKKPTCIDCSSEAASHTIERHGRKLIMEDINFSCGACQKEAFTTNGDVGKVVFVGCTCASLI